MPDDAYFNEEEKQRLLDVTSETVGRYMLSVDQIASAIPHLGKLSDMGITPRDVIFSAYQHYNLPIPSELIGS